MWYIILTILALSFGVNEVYAQSTVEIEIENIQPCFLNMTAGANLWENCGADDDFLTFALMPFEYATGGYFSMILVTIFVIMSYIKYHTALYPMLIGIVFLPISYTLFPEVFLVYAFVFLSIGVTGGIAYLIIRQTRD